MALQDFSHLRHSSMQLCMSPTRSQLFAQAPHTSAQAAETLLCKGESLNMKFAHVWQISAQLIIN